MVVVLFYCLDSVLSSLIVAVLSNLALVSTVFFLTVLVLVCLYWVDSLTTFVLHFKLYKLVYVVFDVLLLADYLSFTFTVLLVFLGFMVVCSYAQSPSLKRMFYYGFFGIFLVSFVLMMSYDVLLFLVLFELGSFPLFVLIGLGSASIRRMFAMFYMMGFMMVGTVCMVLFLVNMVDQGAILSAFDLSMMFIDYVDMSLLLVAMMFFLAVKIPSFPFYYWLPEAHVEASTEGSIVLAGVVLKYASFGVLRFFVGVADILLSVVLMELLYVFILSLAFSLLAIFCQVDIKKIIAYSSVFHMNIAMLALLCFDFTGALSFLVFNLSHGILSSAMFFCLGVTYIQTGSRSSRFLQGLCYICPVLTVWWTVVLLLNINFPFFANFLAEVGLLLSMVHLSTTMFLIVCLAILLGFIFSFYLLCRVGFGSLYILAYPLSDIHMPSHVLLLVSTTISVIMYGVYL